MKPWLDRGLEFLVAWIAAPFDFLQQKLGRPDADSGETYDPTLWL